MFEYVRCNLCAADDYAILFGESKFPNTKLRIVKCNKCGLIYTNPRLDAEELSKLYGNNSYADKTQSGASCLNKEVNKNRFQNYFPILKELKYVGGSILDVGCGVGIFLDNVSKHKSWEIFGVEPSEYASRIAQSRFGKNIIRATLEEAKFDDNFFDVITLWNVLEHVPDPSSLLKEVRRVLKDDGLFIMSVPNISLYYLVLKYFRIKNVFGKQLTWHPQEHLYHFTANALNKFIHKAGFIIYRQAVAPPFMCGSKLDNFIRGIGANIIKLIFLLTGNNYAGFELYLRKSKL